jgi:hypothetical protein
VSRGIPSGVRLLVDAARFDENWFGGNATRVGEDGTFQIKVRPVRGILRATNLPADWTLESVAANGVDVTDGFDLRSGEELREVRVVLTNRVTEISGTVADDGGKPVVDYSVIMFAADRDRWGSNSRFIGVGRPDQAGQFKIRGLPPGEYLAVALAYIEQGAAYDPELLEPLQTKATRVTLGGDRQVLNLRIVQ